MVTVISHRSLSGDYGAYPAGHVFDVDEKTAQSLEARGLVSRYRRPPTVKEILAKMEKGYENKALDVAETAGVGAVDEKSFQPTHPFSFRRPGRPKKNP